MDYNSARSLLLFGCLVAAIAVSPAHTQLKVFRGTLVHSRIRTEMEVLEDYLIGIDRDNYGTIEFVRPASEVRSLAQQYGFNQNEVVALKDSQFLMPGLVDCHIHPAQYVDTGTEPLPYFDFVLNTLIPTEVAFRNMTLAREVSMELVKIILTKNTEFSLTDSSNDLTYRTLLGGYECLSRRTLQHGTTTIAHTASASVDSNLELAKVAVELRQRALIVGLTFDFLPPVFTRPDFQAPSTQQVLNDSRRLIELIRELKNSLIQPSVGPELSSLVTMELLQGLGDMIAEDTSNIMVQGHFGVGGTVEALNTTLTQWEAAGILPVNRTLFHSVHLRESEMEIYRDRGISITHCPISNLNAGNGILDVRRMLKYGINVCLGTDGASTFSVFEVMKVAQLASLALSRNLSMSLPPDYTPLMLAEVFYMATMGGAQATGLGDTVGNFEVGKQFDALLVDTSIPVFDTFAGDTMNDKLQKFLYLGDERNILKVYVAGKESPPRPGQVVNLINDSPRVEGNKITVDLRTDHPVQCGIRLAAMASPLRNCSSTSFSFTNVAPHDTRPYILRVVVIPSTAGSMKTTIRRKIWMPANPNTCTVHLINDGVTVDGDTATVEFASTGPTTTFQCSVDGQSFSACSSPHTFMGLSPGSHSVKIAPNFCGKNRRQISASFVV